MGIFLSTRVFVFTGVEAKSLGARIFAFRESAGIQDCAAKKTATRSIKSSVYTRGRISVGFITWVYLSECQCCSRHGTRRSAKKS